MSSRISNQTRAIIYSGKVAHSRVGPVEHSFAYPLYFYAFDLDQLPNLNSWIFGYNKKRIVSIFDQDYLDRSEFSIKEKLLNYLKKYDLMEEVSRVQLVTSARYFNYVFNPVSFYYCYGVKGQLLYLVAEVNNTFKERHLYLLHQELATEGKYTKHYNVLKSFHVSPFYGMDGQYDFWFTEIGPGIDIKINVLREKDGILKEDFYSRVWGQGQEFNSKNLLKLFVKFPLSASLTYPRIVYQAAKMYYSKKLPVFRKPKPISVHTLEAGPANWLQKLSMEKICSLLRTFDRGFLKIILPNNQVLLFGDPHHQPQAEIEVQHYAFFWKLIKDGAIGLGESYTEKIWETKDLTAVVSYFIANKQKVESRNKLINHFFEKVEFLRHLLRPNSLVGAQKNISAHYDLSNDLFKIFLDPSLMYSSALYSDPRDSLEEAQLNKLRVLIQKAQIVKSDHLLEIGSGWGSFAITVAKEIGCRVTSITISKQQYQLAKERVEGAGLSDLVDIKFCDYRELTGSYDKIVSIEMLEAIGHKNYKNFFSSCERLLKPNGLVVLQLITIPDQYFEQLKSRCDWIQKHIFPGSLLPSMNALQDAMRQGSALQIEEVDNIGPHYARTLADWRANFNQGISKVKALGFDDTFIRAWNYYLSYCEAAFATRTLNVLHLTLTRPGNQNLMDPELFKEQGKFYPKKVANV